MSKVLGWLNKNEVAIRISAPEYYYFLQKQFPIYDRITPLIPLKMNPTRNKQTTLTLSSGHPMAFCGSASQVHSPACHSSSFQQV